MDEILDKIDKAKKNLPPVLPGAQPSQQDAILAKVDAAQANIGATNATPASASRTLPVVVNEIAGYKTAETNPFLSPPVAASSKAPGPAAGYDAITGPVAVGSVVGYDSSHPNAFLPPAPNATPAQSAYAASVPLVSPARGRPTGWQPGTMSEQVALGMDPESLKEARAYADEAHTQRLIANQAEIDASKMRGEAQAAYAAGVVDVAKKYADDYAALSAERKSYSDSELKKQADLSQKIKERVDPNHFWADKSTAAKIGLALSMGLGAFAATLGKTENFAMRIVEKAIDDDIKAQQINLAANKDELDASRSAYAQNLAAFGDRERALMSTKINALDVAKSQLDTNVAKAGTKEAEARGAKLAAEISEMRSKLLTDFAERTNNKVVRSQTAQWAQAQYGGTVNQIKDLFYLEDGSAVNIPDEKRKGEVAGALKAISQIKANFAEGSRLRGILQAESSSSNRSPEYIAAYDQLQQLESDTAAKISVLNQQGALTADEAKEFKKSSAFLKGYKEPSSFGLDTITTMGRNLDPDLAANRKAGDISLADLPKRFDRQAEAIIRAAGGTLVRPALTRDKYGQVVPTYVETGVFNAPDRAPQSFVAGVNSTPVKAPSLGEKLQRQQVAQPPSTVMPLRGPRGR